MEQYIELGLFVKEQEDGSLLIQKSEYIEDGWLIHKKENGFHLYEIPLFGGEESLIDVYSDFESAYSSAMELC